MRTLPCSARLAALVGAMVLSSLGWGCGSQPGEGQGGDAAAAQQTQIAALEQLIVAQQNRGAPAPQPAVAIPTALPPVVGLITEGLTKGSPQAKVTITEYSDFQ